MNSQYEFGRTDVAVARRRVGDRQEVSVDFGPGTDVSVDVTGTTAIVVIGEGADEDVHEIDLPGPEAEAFIHNGVLTLTVTEDAE